MSDLEDRVDAGPQWASEEGINQLVLICGTHWMDPFKVESVHKGTGAGETARVAMDSGQQIYFGKNSREQVAQEINAARRNS